MVYRPQGRLYALLFAFILEACSGADSTDQAQQIVGWVIDAYGGRASWEQIQDACFIETITRCDSARTVIFRSIHYFQRGSRGTWRWRRERLDINTPIVQGYDGTHVWTTVGGRIDDQPETIERARLACRSSLYWFSLPFALQDPDVQLHLLKDPTEGTSDDRAVAYHLEVTFKTAREDRPADGYIYTIDKQTYRISKLEYWQKGRREEATTVLWENLQEQDGLIKPYRWVYVDQSSRPLFQTELEQLRLNQSLNPSLFKKPSAQ